MAIEREVIENVAHLARLHLENHELEEATRSIGNILALIDQMQAVPTEGVPPLAHAFDAAQRLREDAVTERDRREELLKIAPSAEKGLFLVPKVIE